MRVAIDAGHYKGYNKGILAGYYEGDTMWELSLLLKAEMEKYGATVFLTRDSVMVDKSLFDRGKMAAINGCELFLSLHSNAATPDAKGTEIYYSIHRQSKDIADALGAAIVATMKQGAPNTLYRGSKTRTYSAWTQKDYYGVIRAAVGDAGQEPTGHAFLIEHGFHTNAEECAWLMNKANLARLAAVEAQTIAKLFGLSTGNDAFQAQIADLTQQLQIANTRAAGLEMKLIKIKEIAG